MSDRLRSPRERLGGYVILPRLIDKVRLHAQGLLPEPCRSVLRPGLPLDGRFLCLHRIATGGPSTAVLSNDDDEAILAWVTATALLHTSQEIEAWSDGLVRLQPDRALARLLGRLSPELAKQVEFTQHPCSILSTWMNGADRFPLVPDSPR